MDNCVYIGYIHGQAMALSTTRLYLDKGYLETKEAEVSTGEFLVLL